MGGEKESAREKWKGDRHQNEENLEDRHMQRKLIPEMQTSRKGRDETSYNNEQAMEV